MDDNTFYMCKLEVKPVGHSSQNSTPELSPLSVDLNFNIR